MSNFGFDHWENAEKIGDDGRGSTVWLDEDRRWTCYCPDWMVPGESGTVVRPYRYNESGKERTQ